MRALSTAASAVRHTLGVAFEAILILAVIGALVFGASALAHGTPAGAAPVFAAKGGSGNGHGGNAGAGTTTATTLASSCNPCTAGTVVHFSGSGYDASQYKAVMNYSGAVTQVAVAPDGTISQDWPYFTVAGSYTVEAWQSTNGGKLALLASLIIVVQ